MLYSRSTVPTLIALAAIFVLLSPPASAAGGGAPVTVSGEIEVVRVDDFERGRSHTLYYLHGLPVEEVAAVLSLNVNTVKSHLARGRGHLRRRLGPTLTRGEFL